MIKSVGWYGSLDVSPRDLEGFNPNDDYKIIVKGRDTKYHCTGRFIIQTIYLHNLNNFMGMIVPEED